MQIIHFILFFVFVALCIFHRLILNLIGDYLNKPKSTLIYAQVVAKQDRDVGWHGRVWAPILAVYRVTFEFEDRTSIQLRVSGKAYKSLRIDEQGVLAYVDKTAYGNDRFRKFHADKTLEEINH